MKVMKYTFLVSAFVFILLQIVYYPQMPNNFAIHFDAHGKVNGWMPKNANLIISCIIVVIITLSFVGIPYILKRISNDLIKIPKREYWLSADNKERLIKILSQYLYSIGLAMNLFLIFISYQLYRFNIHAIDSVSATAPIILMVPFLIITVSGFTIHLLMRLTK